VTIEISAAVQAAAFFPSRRRPASVAAAAPNRRSIGGAGTSWPPELELVPPELEEDELDDDELLLDDEELLHRDGRLRLDFAPLAARVLYHAPCHARLDAATATPTENLLRLVPELTIQAADRGCSGMAGTFGIAHEHYRTSLRIGRGLMAAMRSADVEAGVTECSACRLQMEQGTSKPTVHPIKVLAKAYGLLPGSGGLDSLLTARSGRLTTT